MLACGVIGMIMKVGVVMVPDLLLLRMAVLRCVLQSMFPPVESERYRELLAQLD